MANQANLSSRMQPAGLIWGGWHRLVLVLALALVLELNPFERRAV